jgi:hypothetical protein
MESENGFLGYVKYTGSSVQEGFLDVRKSAKALLSFDEAVRFFVKEDISELANSDFEIPVRMRKGSWEALIPDTIGKWIMTGTGIAATTYVTTAAKKLAENDFKDASITKAFLKALECIQWFIKIGKHLGTVTQKRFINLRWQNGNAEVGIPNAQNEYLFVPSAMINLFVVCSPKILAGLAELIESDRELHIGIIEAGRTTETSIDIEYKHIFAPSDDPEDILFPELEHGQYVELEGDITRGNENSNTLGFRYNDHILTCYPSHGSIVKYKKTLFLRSKVIGHINRADKFGNITESRPKIIFSNIIPIEADSDQNVLFT